MSSKIFKIQFLDKEIAENTAINVNNVGIVSEVAEKVWEMQQVKINKLVRDLIERPVIHVLKEREAHSE